MITAAKLRSYANDPMKFFYDAQLRPDGPKFGEVMVPEQREFLEVVAPCLLALARRKRPPKRGVWLEAVKGFGKDSMGSICTLWLLCFAPWAIVVQIAADDQQQAGEVKRSLEDWIRANPWLEERIDVQRWRIVNPTTDGSAEVLTSDSSGSHGARPDMILLNEVSHIENETFAATLMDNFTKMPDAFGFLATNAGTLGSWVWTWRELYRQDERWHFAKVTETPAWQTQADIEEARKRNPPGRFRQLYCGEWSAPGGDALDAQAIADAFHPNLQPQTEAMPGFEYVGGLDLGVSRDASAVCILGVHRGPTNHGRISLAYTRVWRPAVGRKVDLQEVEDCAIELNARFQLKALNYDPWACQHMAQRLAAMGLGVAARTLGKYHATTRVPMVEVPQTGQNLQRMATVLIEAFNDRRVALFEDANLRRDLTSMRTEERSYGFRLVSQRDSFGHADLGSSFCLAMLAASELAGKRPPFTVGSMLGSFVVDVDSNMPMPPAAASYYQQQAENEYEEQLLKKGGANYDGREEFLELMRSLGRIS